MMLAPNVGPHCSGAVTLHLVTFYLKCVAYKSTYLLTYLLCALSRYPIQSTIASCNEVMHSVAFLLVFIVSRITWRFVNGSQLNFLV